MKLPRYITEVLRTLQCRGYEAYVVGGCVRDHLLGLCPNDYDVTTSALPEQIISAFEDFKLLTVGIKHGTVTVIIDNKPVEITTFRIDGEYDDSRHPKAVSFTSRLADDLSRRDFTVNAMAFNEKTGIVDLFGGKYDLDRRIIRAVGNPKLRFEEDALRILRALRFAARLSFTVEDNTALAVHSKRHLLSNISAERIQSELVGLLLGDCRRLLYEFSDVITQIIPELAPTIGFDQHSKYHNRTVYEHIIDTVAAAEPVPEYRLAMLLHDVGKPDAFFMDGETGHFYGHEKISRNIAERVLKRLKFSNKITDKVLFLIEHHGITMNATEKYLRRTIAKYGEENFFDLIKIHKYDFSAKALGYSDASQFDEIERSARKYLEVKPCLSLKDLAVSGGDLISRGYKGKEIGETLNFLLNQVIEEACENDKAKLLALVKERN